MSQIVKGQGPMDAKIVLIGEAPGVTEDKLGKPFMGAAGNMLGDWWREIGLHRNQVRIDNLLQRIPPGGKIENESVQTIIDGIINLRARVAELYGPHVIVPTGNYATFALCGKGKVKPGVRNAFQADDVTTSEAEKKAGITSLRGSVYPYETLSGWKCKLIPTIHPSWFLHGNKHRQGVAINDWKRIVQHSTSAEYSAPPRVHLIEPTEHEVAQYAKFIEYYAQELRLALDVETWGNTLSCVGFSHDKDYSITIRTDSKALREVFLPYIQRICSCGCEKILQNGLYDWYWLADHGIKPVNWQWDTMAMAHALNTVGQFSLEYLCSMRLFWYQYWKDEAKDAEEIKKFARDLQALWVYNGLDCCNTWELQGHLYKELQAAGRVDYYNHHYRDLFRPLLSTMRHGVQVDAKRQAQWCKGLMLRCGAARQELADLAGEDLFAKKDFSKVKLKKFFHETLGLPKRYKRTKGVDGWKRTQTLDKHALNDFIVKGEMPRYKKQYGPAKEPAMLILGFRRDKKKADSMRGAWDKDERIRCEYTFRTESGRLSSKKNPKRKGYNLQNPSRKIRGTFLPDKGCVFVKVDLSQVEDRVVKMLTGAQRMVEIANRRPEEFDAHTYNAARIYKVSEADVTYDQRYMSKRVVHGAERGMSGMMLSLQLLADEDAPLVVNPVECQKLIDTFLDDHWEFRDLYFPGIRQEMWDNHCLTNTWGRVWDLGEYVEFDDDLYQKGYSFKPQSKGADMLNQHGLVPAYNFIKAEGLETRINLQVHDELIFSSPPDEAYDIAKFVVDSLEQPRWFLGNKLVVPAEVTVARSWKDSRHEFKSLPKRSVFEEVAFAVYEEMRSE